MRSDLPELSFRGTPICAHMPMISIAEPLQINAIVWIHSLPENEMGPTRRILEDLDAQTLSGGPHVFTYGIANRAELFQLLDRLAREAAQGLRPIIHLDAHGNQSDGLWLAPDDEWASWDELLERLRAINVATGNNLVVVFALCHGLHLYKLVELTKAAPAYLFAASDDVIHVDFLEQETVPFYREVQQQGAFLGAFEATLGKKMTLMNCQGLLLKALAHYVKNQCQPKVLDTRAERLASEMLQRDGVTDPSPDLVCQYQKRAREALEPDQKIIDRFAPHFLIGRQPGFTYADVERLAGRRQD